jgi:Domain of unknown function (DUF892)
MGLPLCFGTKDSIVGRQTQVLDQRPSALAGVFHLRALLLAQRVEHYEIAAYGCVRTWAELLGESEASALLDKTLAEEKETDQKLTQLAQEINLQAKEEGSEGEEGEEAEEEHPRGKARGARA